MSVTGQVIFVDWAAVEDQWRDDPRAFWRDDFWDFEADDPWPSRFEAEYFEPAGWIESWSHAAGADECYTRLRGDLDPGERARWDELIGTFFQIDRAPSGYDLPGFVPEEGISNIIGPASLDRLAAEIERVDFERLRGPFVARCRPDPYSWVEDFDEFRALIRQWFAAVAAARAAGKALVRWVA